MKQNKKGNMGDFSAGYSGVVLLGRTNRWRSIYKVKELVKSNIEKVLWSPRPCLSLSDIGETQTIEWLVQNAASPRPGFGGQGRARDG